MLVVNEADWWTIAIAIRDAKLFQAVPLSVQLEVIEQSTLHASDSATFKLVSLLGLNHIYTWPLILSANSIWVTMGTSRGT